MPGRAALPRARRSRWLPVSRGTRGIPQRHRDSSPRGRSTRVVAETEGGRGHHAAAAGPGRTGEFDPGDRIARCACRHHCQLSRHQAGREAGLARDHRDPRAARARRDAPDAPCRGAEALAPDRGADQGSDRRPPARVRAARAVEADPERARGRSGRPGRRGTGGSHCEGRHAARSRRACAQGAEASRAHERGERRVLDGAHVPGHADRAAVVKARRGIDRHPARPRHPRCGPLRSREDQEAHPRVPRGAQAEPRRPQPDPVLRRASRRGQDFARPVDRARGRPQVPAHQPRRYARRG